MPENNATVTTSTRHQPAKRGGRSASVIVSAVVAVLILAALVVFVAQNSQRVELRYLSANTTVGFGVALLVAAVAGAVFALLVSSVIKIRRSLRD